MEEARLTGSEFGAAKEEISWKKELEFGEKSHFVTCATRNMIWDEGVPALSNSAWN